MTYGGEELLHPPPSHILPVTIQEPFSPVFSGVVVQLSQKGSTNVVLVDECAKRKQSESLVAREGSGVSSR